MAGCYPFDSEPTPPKNTSSETSTNNRTRIDFSKAENKVRDARAKMDPTAEPPEPTVKQVKADVTAAMEELDIDNNGASACACPSAIGEAKVAYQVLTLVSNRIGTSSKKVSEVAEDTRKELQTNLDSALTKIENASELVAAAQAIPSATPVKSAPEVPKPETNDSVWGPILLAAKIVAGLLILTILVFGFLHFRNQSQQHLERHLGKAAAAHASVTREAQKDILDKLSSLTSAQSDTRIRLHDVQTEIRTLARLVRESSVSRGDGRSYASLAASYSYNDPSPKEEPEFPVSAFDYLDKMTRYSNVVKPDFQNGILINDPDGTGELMLIRDSRVPDETQPLFVVPRHAQFQTKQDFYTYYEKYYDCVRPGAGDVWIIDPAVVEKVSGGWQLREKGVLEIR
jgi:hypothetical protein